MGPQDRPARGGGRMNDAGAAVEETPQVEATGLVVRLLTGAERPRPELASHLEQVSRENAVAILDAWWGPSLRESADWAGLVALASHWLRLGVLHDQDVVFRNFAGRH